MFSLVSLTILCVTSSYKVLGWRYVIFPSLGISCSCLCLCLDSEGLCLCVNDCYYCNEEIFNVIFNACLVNVPRNITFMFVVIRMSIKVIIVINMTISLMKMSKGQENKD